MRAAIRILDLLVFSNLYVAVPVTALTLLTFLVIGQPPQWQLLAFVYSSTLFLYCFHSIYKLEEVPEQYLNKRHRWVLRNKRFFILVTALAIISTIVFSLFLSKAQLLTLFPLGIIAFAYSVPLIPFKDRWVRLRDLPFLKVVLIAIVAGTVTVLLPILGKPELPEGVHWLLLLERILFILAITIPFDIRDMQYDAFYKLQTIPLYLGKGKAITISLVCLLLFCVVVLLRYGYTPGAYSWQVGAFLGSAVLTAFTIIRSRKRSGEYYYSFLLEGTMIAQLILFVLALSI